MISTVFSYRGKSSNLKEAVGAIVSNHSKKLLEKYKATLESKLKMVAEVWSDWMKMKLSVPATPFVQNTTLYPKMRTGKLRAAIRAPNLQITKYSGPASELPSYKIKLKGLFGLRSSKNISDVGQFLNDWSGKSFSHWKTRGQRELYDRMIREIKGR